MLAVLSRYGGGDGRGGGGAVSDSRPPYGGRWDSIPIRSQLILVLIRYDNHIPHHHASIYLHLTIYPSKNKLWCSYCVSKLPRWIRHRGMRSTRWIIVRDMDGLTEWLVLVFGWELRWYDTIRYDTIDSIPQARAAREENTVRSVGRC